MVAVNFRRCLSYEGSPKWWRLVEIDFNFFRFHVALLSLDRILLYFGDGSFRETNLDSWAGRGEAQGSHFLRRLHGSLGLKYLALIYWTPPGSDVDPKISLIFRTPQCWIRTRTRSRTRVRRPSLNPNIEEWENRSAKTFTLNKIDFKYQVSGRNGKA